MGRDGERNGYCNEGGRQWGLKSVVPMGRGAGCQSFFLRLTLFPPTIQVI